MHKTIFITGSTDGIGKLAAIKLAREGHQLIIHGRNSKKTEAVVSEIKDTTGNKKISAFTADLSDLHAVKGLADQVRRQLSGIDVLINNAGVFKSEKLVTKDHLDMRMTVNYLAPFVLTHGLLPLIKKSEAPRIINLSSAAQSPVSMAVLRGEKQVSEQASYAQSKLALTMWSFYLAKKYPDIGVIAVNPGSLLDTNMVREAYGKSWSSADKGANILYDLVVHETYSGITAKYFDNDRGSFGKAHADAYNQQAVENLIKTTEAIRKELGV